MVIKRALYTLIFLLLIVSSCKDKETDVNDVLIPTNLTVEINVSTEEIGKVTIIAHADNTVEYKLYIDAKEEAEASNTSGEFEFLFTEPGDHLIIVRAYATSGRYAKEQRTVTIGEEDPVSVEDGYFSATSYDGLEMVWNDEFDGSAVNTDFWTFETGAGGWGNNELQFYRKENASVDGGTLIIEARKETYQESNYTSARMVTRNKKSFKYGRLDIRALLPEGQGIWPALWMLGNNFQSAGWPACGELDIMEMIGGNGRENTTYGTVHWDDNGHVQAGGATTLLTGIFGDEYHVFSIIWDQTSIQWLMNDKQFYVINTTPAHMTEFHEPFFFIFNVAVGGNWPGYPNASTVFPQQMKVDYIRVFQ